MGFDYHFVKDKYINTNFTYHSREVSKKPTDYPSKPRIKSTVHIKN